MFYLSGTINVVLFLISRPKLLLFPHPNLTQPDDEEHELNTIAVTPSRNGGTSPAISSERTNFQRGLEPTSAALGDEGPKDSTTPSHVSLSDDLDI